MKENNDDINAALNAFEKYGEEKQKKNKEERTKQIDALREFESKPNNREFGGAKAKKKSSKKPPAEKKKPPAAATGKVHTGPRGGKYVIRKGKKVYL